MGFDLPASACRATCAGDRAALWQGPDEWLLLSTAASGDRAQAPLNEASLEEALQGLPHSLVNVSHRQIGLELRGLHAALLLAAGCPLDLEAGAFPVGMCTRTVLAKAEVVLWRTDPQLFRLEVWRSFATYVAAFLTESARGL
ncbi:MAG: sarcosine oxidase subunit gamma [Candidatus Dormibacteria bacterium]